MKKIYITGIAGTGKTTVSEELQKRGFYTISIDETDDLCSWVDRETNEKVQGKAELTREFTSKHQWVCDADYLKKLMNVDEEIIFVLGITSNQSEYLDVFNTVLLLQCKPEVFLERLKNRTNNTFGKDKAIRDHMLDWYEGFETRLIAKGASPIDASLPIDKVVDEVIKQAFLDK
jgi:broad-specificity NMP kinase